VAKDQSLEIGIEKYVKPTRPRPALTMTWST